MAKDLPVWINPEHRADALKRERQLKMARSAHAYVRGSTKLFYEWLADSRVAAHIPDGPPVWICGDCHVGNLGPLAAADGSVEVQIRDLDQTVISNPAFDLIRLALSLATAVRSSDLPGVTTALMLEEMVRGYELAMRDPEADDLVPEPSAVKLVRRRALSRKWRHLARERMPDVRAAIPLGKRFWPTTKDEHAALEKMLAQPTVHKFVLGCAKADESSEVRMLDGAYWMKGCSSLGSVRFAILLEVVAEKVAHFALVDIKEAMPTVAPSVEGVRMPRDPAKRVVTGARALSPNLGDRMVAAKLGKVPVIVRELMPQDLKLELDQFSRAEATHAARYLAYVVGRAHGRQMDAPTRREWHDMLLRQTS